MVSAAGIYRDYPELLGSNLVDTVVEKLKEAKREGVDTIVDATTLDLGRDVTLMAEVSRRSGVNIIACTGWWLDIPPFLDGVSEDQLEQVFTREIEKGISGTSIKAGVLKAASDLNGVTPGEEVILRAIARTHHKTGVPIMLHSYAPGRVGQQQLSILKNEGVNGKYIKMDHSNDTADLEYLTWLRDQGCYLGVDRYPGFNLSAMGRTRIIKSLIDLGYSDYLCPSHDWSLIYIKAKNPCVEVFSEEERQKLNPHGYLYIKRVVIPQLREMGVSDDILNNLGLTGPRHFFEGR